MNLSTPPAHDIQAIFNRIAPADDALNDRLSLGLHRIWKQMTVKWCSPAPGDTCLDVCCGSGDLAQLLAQQVGNTGSVYGVDFSAAQLEIAHQRTDQAPPHSPVRQIQWVEADALQLPFAENFFDAATMGYGLRNVTHKLGSLQELYRVLKPKAIVAILDFHRPQNPQLRTFQQWYLDTIVVPTAEQMGLRDEYAYITPSLDRFPTGQAQVTLAQQAGFSTAIHYPIAGGMMGVLVATK